MTKDIHYIAKPDVAHGTPPKRVLRWQTLSAVALGLGLFFISLTVIGFHIRSASYREIIAQFTQVSWVYLTLAFVLTLISFGVASYEDAREAGAIKGTSLFGKILSAFVANAVANITEMGSLAGPSLRNRLLGAWSVNVVDMARFGASTQSASVLSAIILSVAALLLNHRFVSEVYAVPPIIIYTASVALTATATAYWLYGLRVAGAIPERLSVSFAKLMISAAKWLSAAAAFYVCLHGSSDAPFSFIILVFILAHSVGRISGLPGGIGVFEAVCLSLLPMVAVVDLIIALIAYRALYFFAPLILAAVIIGLAKTSRINTQILRRGGQALDIFQLVAPPLYAVLIFLAGAIMLLSAATPDRAGVIPFLGDRIGIYITELSHLLASLMACLLLIIAVGLQRRLENAWAFATAFMLAGAVFTILKGADPKIAGILLVLALCLFVSRDAFYRKGSIRNIPLSWPRFGLIVAAVGFAIWVGFYSYLEQPYRHSLWWDFGADGNISRFLRGFVLIGAVVSLYGFWRSLQPAPRVSTALSGEALATKLRAVLSTAESPGSESNLAFMGDKQFLFSDSGQSFIMYGVKGRNWVAMGDPVGLKSERKELIWAFRQLADSWDAWPCFYAVRDDDLNDYIDAGLALQKIGEMAIVSLTDFSMEGKKRSELRNSKSRALREGCSFEVIYPAANAPEMDDLERVSQSWLQARQGKEKRFSLGRFDRNILSTQPIAIIRQGGVIIAFANLWTTADKSEIAVDLMRYEDVKINGLMDYLFAEIMLWAQAQGYARFSLGLAPLSGLEGDRLAPFMTKLGALIFEHGGRFYSFKGLRAFKQKFMPEWEPVYLAAPSQLTMPVAIGNLALLNSGGILGIVQK